jgi:hypothetical protein
MSCSWRKSLTDSAMKGFAVGERMLRLFEDRLAKCKPRGVQFTGVGILVREHLPLLALDSEGRGVGEGIEAYGFFAFIAPTRSVKLSR